MSDVQAHIIAFDLMEPTHRVVVAQFYDIRMADAVMAEEDLIADVTADLSEDGTRCMQLNVVEGPVK